MKRIRLFSLLFVFFLLISGCNNQISDEIGAENGYTVDQEGTEKGTEGNADVSVALADDRVELSEYQFDQDIETVKAASYKKLIFDDCTFSDLDGVEQVGIYRLGGKVVTPELAIKAIKQWLEEHHFEDIDLKEQLRDASGQFERNDDLEYPYDYPAVIGHETDFHSGRGFFLFTNQCYIQMGDTGFYSMSDGSISRYVGGDSKAAFDALGGQSEDIVDSGLVAQKGEEEWELPVGKRSIGEMAEIAKAYFEAGTPFQNCEGVTVDVPEVNVFAIGEKYGYAFTIRRVYKGVPFTYEHNGTKTYYSDYEVEGDVKTAYMIDDAVNAFTGYSEAENLEGMIEEQTKIIRISDAASALNDFMANRASLRVRTAGLVYCKLKYNNEEKQTAYPCWEFLGTTNGRQMRWYVNALSGEIYYYSEG